MPESGAGRALPQESKPGRFIHTRLQPGDEHTKDTENRFNGLVFGCKQ
jgi:hypothetical protein